MKSRILMLVAILGLVGSGIAFAQDGDLGKKGNKGGGGSGGSGGSHGNGGNSGGKGGGVKNEPPPQKGGGSVGGGQSNGGGSRGNGNGGSQTGGGSSRGNGNGGSQSGDGQLGRGGNRGGNTGGQVGRSGGGTGTSSGGTILGRPDRGSSSGGDVVFGKRDSGSRSGKVVYSGDHNIVQRNDPITIADIPIVTSKRRVEHDANRENRVTVVPNDRYRNGYSHYDRGWHDNDFCYPYYGFQYYDGCNYVPSPFYYYSHLPGYIDIIRVNIGPFSWTRCETRYDWSPPRYDRYGYEADRYGDFDYCVSDIERSFESRNLRYISHLIPVQGRVHIDMGAGDQYTLNSDDFYDMMRDLIEGTRTTNYRIRDIYRDGDQATIYAVHEFTDSWGRTQCVNQTFGLERGRRGYEITYFRTDRG